MPIKDNGPLSLEEIATEYRGTRSHSMSEYYGTPGNISSGPISFSDFYGDSDFFTVGGTRTTTFQTQNNTSQTTFRSTFRTSFYTTFYTTVYDTVINPGDFETPPSFRTTSRTTSHVTSVPVFYNTFFTTTYATFYNTSATTAIDVTVRWSDTNPT